MASVLRRSAIKRSTCSLEYVRARQVAAKTTNSATSSAAVTAPELSQSIRRKLRGTSSISQYSEVLSAVAESERGKQQEPGPGGARRASRRRLNA